MTQLQNGINLTTQSLYMLKKIFDIKLSYCMDYKWLNKDGKQLALYHGLRLTSTATCLSLRRNSSSWTRLNCTAYWWRGPLVFFNASHHTDGSTPTRLRTHVWKRREKEKISYPLIRVLILWKHLSQFTPQTVNSWSVGLLRTPIGDMVTKKINLLHMYVIIIRTYVPGTSGSESWRKGRRLHEIIHMYVTINNRP